MPTLFALATSLSRGYCHADIYPKISMAGIIDDRAVRNCSIGKNDSFVFWGQKNGIENLDFIDDSCLSVGFDEVSNLEWFKN
jgi:hypothetical protein